MPLTVGGGVRAVDDVRRPLTLAAPTRSRSTPRRSARPRLVRRRPRSSAIPGDRGRGRRQEGLEPPRRPPRWDIFTHGGRDPTGLDAVAYAQEVAPLGAGEILLTSMDRDGTAVRLRHRAHPCVADAVPVPVIASGGVGALEHLVEGVTHRRRHRGARRLDLPFRRAHRREAKARMAQGRRPDAARSVAAGARAPFVDCLRAMRPATPTGCR